MRVIEQLEAFTERLSLWSNLQSGFKERRATGASNTPFPIKGGFRLGIWNIENTDFLGLLREGKSLVVVSPITLPPGDNTICTAIVFQGTVIQQISRRRDEIRVELDKRPNNVGFFLHRGGLLLSPLTDLTDVSFVDQSSPEIGGSIPVSAAAFADVQRPHAIDTIGEAYVGYLAELLWPIPFMRLDSNGVAIEQAPRLS